MNNVIVEKYKKPDYITDSGISIWLNKYGDIIKRVDKYGRQLTLNFDVKEQLVAILSEQMAIEIDNQIIQDLLAMQNKNTINFDVKIKPKTPIKFIQLDFNLNKKVNDF